MKKQWKQKLKKTWKEWRSFFVVVFILLAFRSAVADWYYVPTGSMKPTILEGDRIFVNKLAYDLKIPFIHKQIRQWSNPERGEVVIFPSPVDGKRLIKRVIGLPGDDVEMKNNHLMINDRPAQYQRFDGKEKKWITDQSKFDHLFVQEIIGNEDYPVMITPQVQAIRSFGPIRVPEGHYFVLGDNRDDSLDSRYFGFIERKRILGQATLVLLSHDRTRFYLPRNGRYFQKLP